MTERDEPAANAANNLLEQRNQLQHAQLDVSPLEPKEQR